MLADAYMTISNGTNASAIRALSTGQILIV